MTRYHPALVALHWLMALMILGALAGGGIALASLPMDSQDKVTGLAGHMSFGLAIGVLLCLRLLVRVSTQRPAHAQTGNAILDMLGRWTHWGFYLLIGAMVLSGLATALGAGLFPIVFGGSGDPLPPEINTLPQRAAHGFVALALLGLIILHLCAAVYHQAILRDGLLRRMWFGSRS
ncbi:MAG: cytochrome b/b6 domain-containing protein [Pseudomonadota bacterium]